MTGLHDVPEDVADKFGLEGVLPEAHEVTDNVASITAEWLRSQRWLLPITKASWVAKAVVYAVIGWTAVALAVGRPGAETDAEYTGFVELLAERWWSRVALGLIALGLVFYVAFRVLTILLIDSVDLDGWAHRIGYAVSAGTYVAVGWAAFDAAFTGPSGDGGSSVNRFTAELLGTTAGRIAVGVAALGAWCLAGYFSYKGATRSFLSQLDLGDTARPWARVVEWLGAIGWLGRGAIVAVLGLFLGRAAIQADPSDARGLDQALQDLAVSSGAGAATVVTVGILMILYAAFCAISAPCQSLTWSRRNDPGLAGPGPEISKQLRTDSEET